MIGELKMAGGLMLASFTFTVAVALAGEIWFEIFYLWELVK